ncbi:MAG: thioredoxin domain-containing protein [Trueperaceae bacterium]|nr:thioredoxin domain-containing protein [Trueperaceae bacterium]
MNALQDAASPYLRQHADDPVDWHPWGQDAFAEARRRDVPLFVSIGYASCHWCHVMQHESFQDPDLAALLNDGFVPVKVDREERPDVDAVYMSALQAMRGQGGWPLTAITDAEGRTFFAGTYYPPDDRPGMPSLRRVLDAVSDAWRHRRDGLLEEAAKLDAHLRRAMEAPAGPALDPASPVASLPDPSREALAALAARYDRAHGGFGGAPKFPPHGVLRWLLMRDEPEAREMAVGTLRGMERGGITDPLAGGVARYAVDEAWRVPHFEKMTSDNAQLLPRFAEAYLRSGDTALWRAAQDTFAWLRHEMRLEDGTFATALDADSEGREGAFYAWTAPAFDEVVRAAAEEAGAPAEDEVAFARAAFDVAEVGPFEGLNVLRAALDPGELAERFELPLQEAEVRLARIRARLFAARAHRPRPARDDKVLTAVQGMVIQGAARAGRMLEDPEMVEVARETAVRVLTRMLAPDGTLWRRAFGERAGIAARLEDHAFLGLGLLELHRADGDPRWLAAAARQAEAVEARFAGEDGGYLGAPEEDDPLPMRPRSLLDAAQPADTVAAAELEWRVGRLRGEREREARATRAVTPLAEVAARHPEAAGSALTLLALMRAPAREAAVTGPADAGGAALWAEVARRPLDAWAVQRAPDAGGAGAEADPTLRWPLVEDRGTVDGRAAGWLCEGYACRLPLTDPDAWARALDDARS